MFAALTTYNRRRVPEIDLVRCLFVDFVRTDGAICR